MRVNKNIKHLLNSESFLPASSAGVQPFVRQPQQCPPGSLIKTMCNDCINGRQMASRQYEYAVGNAGRKTDWTKTVSTLER